MASSEDPESEHDDTSLALSFIDPPADAESVGTVANEDGGVEALSGDDVLERDETMETREEAALSNLCIRVTEVMDLVWRESRASNDQERRCIYAKFFIEPSNMSVSTKVFSDADTCSVEPVRLLLPTSLTVQSSKTFLLVEIWEVKSEVHHELIGHSRRPVHKLVEGSATSCDFILTRKRGKAQCGKISLSVTLEALTNVLSPALLWEEIKTHRCHGCLQVMVLECQGLQGTCDSVFVSCQYEQSKVWLHSDTGNYDQEQHVLVWNHWFHFDLAVNAMKDGAVLLQVNDEANQLDNDEASILGSARLELSTWAGDAAVFCAWMPLRQSCGEEEAQPYARIRIACCFVLEEALTLVEAKSVAKTISTQRSTNDATQPTDRIKPFPVESPLVMSLGSLLEIRVKRTCKLSPEAVACFSTLSTTECDSKQRMSVHGLLLLGEETSQRTVVAASVSVEADHCSGHQCAVLCTADGGQVVLRFELGPDVTSTALPQVRVDIRAKRPQTWRFSFSLALPVLLRQLSSGAEYQLRCPLLDREDNAAGWLESNFLCGRRDELESFHHQRIAVVHMPEARTMTLQVMDLQISSEANGSFGNLKCFANVWSSSAGKRHAQTVSSLAWVRTIEADRPQKRSCAVSFFAHDVATEVVFVAIHRYSARERNAQIAFGSFGLCELAMPIDESSECTVVEHHVRLFSSVNTGNILECGRMRLVLQLSRVPLAEQNTNPRPCFAATSLGEVAYPVQACETRCRLDIGVLKAHRLPTFLMEGDTIMVCLRVVQSKWQTELPGARVVLDRDTGEKVAFFGGNVHAIIHWSPKDRLIPTLEVSMRGYLRIQSQQNTTRRRSSIASNGRRKCSADLRSHNAASSGTSEERVIATASMSLCSFFTQPNTWVHSEMEMTPGDCPTTMYCVKANGGSSPTSLLTSMRLSSIRDGNTSEAVLPESENPRVDAINGSVCIHLLHASGTFLGKETRLSEFYVSMATSSELATSSSRAVSYARTVTWNEHFALPVHRSVPPIVRLCICRRAMASPGADKLANTGSTRLQMIQHDDDEMVGVLSIPIFPSITQSHHLVHFDLPFESPSFLAAKPPDARVKQGILSLDMQFLEGQTSIARSHAVQQTVELVIHRLRGDIRESNIGTDYSVFPKHVIFDVSLMTESGRKENGQSIARTNVVSLSGSETREIEEVVDITVAAAMAIRGLDSPAVLAVKIRDLNDNPCGRVHVPLRSDWKETLVRNKKRTWYSIHDDTSVALANSENKEDAPALLMSLRIDEESGVELASKGVGRFYVKVEEAVPHSTGLGNAKLFRGSNKIGATVIVVSDSLSGVSGANKYRTRQSNMDEIDNCWRWKNEWFGVDNPSRSADASQQLRICVHASEGPKSKQREFTTNMHLTTNMKKATLELVDHWLVLREPAGGKKPEASVHLRLALVYIPTLNGCISMEFADARAFSESELTPLVEKTFFKCQFCKTSYATPALAVEGECLDNFEGEPEHYLGAVQIPFDSCMVKASDGLPSFIIRWMGMTKSLGEICLGEFSVSLLSVLNVHTVGMASHTSQAHSYQKWYSLTDKGDRSRKAGVVRLSTTFKRTANRPGDQSRQGNNTPRKHQAASAEALAVWKKLFYLLDENANGYIDQDEFTEAFVRHGDDMLATSDGQQLVQLLFGEPVGNDEGTTQVPTAQDVQALFAETDLNRDNKIEWKEYLQLIQRKQQHRMITAEQQEDELQSSPQPELAFPQLEQTKELRKKKREDTSVLSMGIAGHPSSISNSTGVPVAQSDKPRRTRCSVSESNQDNSPRAEMGAIRAMSEAKSTVKQYPPPTRKSSYRQSFGSKHTFSNEEQRRLHQHVASLESLLDLERQRFADLSADRQALLRSYQKLHLQHQSGIIQEQTKTKWMEQTIERQQQLLEEREVHRRKQYGASVVLQSTVRSRLEQRRFQGRKLQRANAAITIQCLARRAFAVRELDALRKANREAKCREKAATKLQWFARYHVARKERSLLMEARELSAVILQKYARRMISVHGWKRWQLSTLQLQCWIRQCLAGKRLDRLRDAAIVIKSTLRVWVLQWQYQRIKAVCVQIQRWWRQARLDHSVFLQLAEAAICIQSIGRQYLTIKRFARERERQECFLAELEAAICIQATWRGKHERLLTPRAPMPLSDAEVDGIEACVSAENTLERDSGCLELSSSSEPRWEGQDEQQLQMCTASKGQASSGRDIHAAVGDDAEVAVEMAKVLTDVLDSLDQQFGNTLPLTEWQTPSSLSTQRNGDLFSCALGRELPSIAMSGQSLFEAGGSACGDSVSPLNEPEDVTKSSADADDTKADLNTEVVGVLESIVTAVLRAAKGTCGDPTSLDIDAGKIDDVSGKSNDSDEADRGSGGGLAGAVAVRVAVAHPDGCGEMGDVDPPTKYTEDASDGKIITDVIAPETLEGQHKELAELEDPPSSPARSRNTTMASAVRDAPAPAHDAACSEASEIGHDQVVAAVSNILDEMKVHIEAAPSSGDYFNRFSLDFDSGNDSLHAGIGVHKICGEPSEGATAAGVPLDCGSDGESAFDVPPADEGPLATKPSSVTAIYDGLIHTIAPEAHPGSTVDPATLGGEQRLRNQIEAIATESMGPDQPKVKEGIVKPTMKSCDLEQDAGPEPRINLADEEKLNEEGNHEAPYHDELSVENAALVAHSADETLLPKDTNPDSGDPESATISPVSDEINESVIQSSHRDVPSNESSGGEPTHTTRFNKGAVTELLPVSISSEAGNGMADLKGSAEDEDGEADSLILREGDSALSQDIDDDGDDEEPIAIPAQFPVASASTIGDLKTSEGNAGGGDSAAIRSSENNLSTPELRPARQRSSAKRGDLENGAGRNHNEGDSVDGGDDDNDSMDSDDLMWEADAMASLDADGGGITSIEHSKRPRRREGRRDSLEMLADSRLLKAQGSTRGFSSPLGSPSESPPATGCRNVDEPDLASLQ